MHQENTFITSISNSRRTFLRAFCKIFKICFFLPRNLEIGSGISRAVLLRAGIYMIPDSYPQKSKCFGDENNKDSLYIPGFLIYLNIRGS